LPFGGPWLGSIQAQAKTTTKRKAVKATGKPVRKRDLIFMFIPFYSFSFPLTKGKNCSGCLFLYCIITKITPGLDYVKRRIIYCRSNMIIS